MDIQPGVMTLEESVSALQTSFTIAYLLAPTIAILFIIIAVGSYYRRKNREKRLKIQQEKEMKRRKKEMERRRKVLKRYGQTGEVGTTGQTGQHEAGKTYVFSKDTKQRGVKDSGLEPYKVRLQSDRQAIPEEGKRLDIESTPDEALKAKLGRFERISKHKKTSKLSMKFDKDGRVIDK